MGREEQAKYYELARRERQLHMQMYPDWSSRTNASRGKKRKRKQESNDGGSYTVVKPQKKSKQKTKKKNSKNIPTQIFSIKFFF